MDNSILNLLTSPGVLAAVFVGAGVIILVYILKLIRKEDESDVIQKPKNEIASHSDKKRDAIHSSKPKKKLVESRWSARNEKQAFSHNWLLTSLKGHTGTILDMEFSSTSKYLSSCGDDRAVFIWDTKDLAQKDRKSLRVNIEFDYATKVKWSPDSKAFIISKFNENVIEVYKVEKKKDGWLQASKALTFPKAHETDIIGMGIACNGKFIMTCSNKTDMILWDLKGEKLAQIDTYLMNTTCAKISPCGRFIVAAGFTPEARVWEVVFNKAGEFVEAKQIVELTLGGHTSGIYDVAFDANSSHMATVSKDGTWNLYDTNVNYKMGEDARIQISGKYEQSGSNALIALSPNAQVVVIATFNTISFYSTFTGEKDHCIRNIYTGNVTGLLFDPTGKYILTSGDKQIRIFHNITGYYCTIQSVKRMSLENQTSATKERIQHLVAECQYYLKHIGSKDFNPPEYLKGFDLK